MFITKELIKSLETATEFRLTLDQVAAPNFPELLLAIQDAPKLQYLCLGAIFLGRWDEARVRLLAIAIERAPRLQTLSLSNSNLDAMKLAQVKLLMAAIQGAGQLQALYLDDNALGDWEEAQVLCLMAAIEHAPQLRTLGLSNNKFCAWKEAQIRLLMTAIGRAPRLQSLDFSSFGGPLVSNNLGAWNEVKVELLATAIEHAPQLQTLDLHGNNLGAWNEAQVRRLVTAIGHASQLQTLDLSNNEIYCWGSSSWGGKKFNLLIESIEMHPTLEAIRFEGMKEAGIDYILRDNHIKRAIESYNVVTSHQIPDELIDIIQQYSLKHDLYQFYKTKLETIRQSQNTTSVLSSVSEKDKTSAIKPA